MKCPVCGAKMIDDKICRYCNVTSDEVLNASNIEAKRAFKEKRKDDVCYTTDIPSDVNKKKLVLFTVFLGLYGVHNFYIGRLYKGLYNAISVGGLILSGFLEYFLGLNAFTFYFGRFFLWLTVVNLFMWFSDIVNLIFNKFKVPVVLPKTENKVKHHSIKNIKG